MRFSNKRCLSNYLLELGINAFESTVPFCIFSIFDLVQIYFLCIYAVDVAMFDMSVIAAVWIGFMAEYYACLSLEIVTKMITFSDSVPTVPSSTTVKSISLRSSE